MALRLFVVSIGDACDVYAGGQLATVTPTPPYPGASPSLAYKVEGTAPVFAYRIRRSTVQLDGLRRLQHDGKVHVTVNLVHSARGTVKPVTSGRWLTNIHPQIKAYRKLRSRPAALSRDLHQRRAAFFQHGIDAVRRRARGQRPKPGDPNVVNIWTQIDNTGKTVETRRSTGHCDVSAKPGGGVLFFRRGR